MYLLLSGGSDKALSQSAPVPPLTVVSSSVKHDLKSITLEFVASNNSNARIYIRNLSLGDGQDGSLSSGGHLQYPQIRGIELCRHDIHNCTGQSGMNLNEYSYIEPGSSISFTFTYNTSAPLRDQDTLSMTVILIERQAQPNDDTHAGPARIARFQIKAVL
jgi:hypothetical protein